MQNVLIYGTGAGAKKLYKKVASDYHVVGFVVTSKDGQPSAFFDKPVWALSEIALSAFDLIIIANEYSETYFNCINAGVERSKIQIATYRCFFDVMEQILAEEAPAYSQIIQPCSAVLTKGIQYQTGFDIENGYHSQRDYVRFKLLELLADQIHRDNVHGAVAELGVYQGDFAKHINALFPDRPLFLFDTFEGFDSRDEEFDVDAGLAKAKTFNNLQRFSNTSVELVLSKMVNPEVCDVRKGFFPDTVQGLETDFSLVSLDADLYKPMLAGLDYFYPRLSKGGFLLLHEYNHPGFLGVKQAVKDFEQKHGALCKVPVPDNNGTLVVTK